MSYVFLYTFFVKDDIIKCFNRRYFSGGTVILNLVDRLLKHHKDDIYPYHMPGHKRKPMTRTLERVADLDITEIDGFDNLNHPENLLLDMQQHAANVYGAEESFYLVGGSTLGILSAISATTREGDTILIGRNCHKSVYHAAYLRNLNLEYLWPEYDSEWEVFTRVSVASVESKLEQHPEAKVVLITSPTYEGFCSDIEHIAKVVHSRGKVLIVDEAHGAHFGFHTAWPKSAICEGADVVIQSLHKTLPSMTQTAMMHVSGQRVDKDRLKRFLSIYQTSSPSYVFMSSIEEAVSYMENNGKEAMETFRQLWLNMLQRLQQCECIDVYMDPEQNQDIGKLMISASRAGVDGQTLHEILRGRFSLQMEMSQGKYVLAMFTVADGVDAYDRLAEALLVLDQEFKTKKDTSLICYEDKGETIQPEKRCSIAKAWEADCEWIGLEGSISRCAGEFVNLYPPGVPIVVPGEIFSQNMVNIIKRYCALKLPVQGVKQFGDEVQVKVLKRK